MGLVKLGDWVWSLCWDCAFTSGTGEETASASSFCGGERMAGTDNGKFDLRALQRVGDFTSDRAERKRWSFVFKGYVGAASPRLLELMNQSLKFRERSLSTV